LADFDCIVIGGGIGGLCTAARLAAKGAHVLLLEKNKTPGGYLQSFKRKGVTFDSSVDCFSGFDKKGVLRLLLRSLGVEEDISTIKLNTIRTSIFPNLNITVHAKLTRYIEELKGLFPNEARGITSLFNTMGDIYKEIEEWGDSITNMTEPRGIPYNILNYRNASYGALLNKYITDSKLKAVLSDRCPFYGLGPSKVSATGMTAMIMSYFTSGAYRIKGGSQNLADAILKGIRKKGGNVMLGTKAVKILMNKDRAIGVRTYDGSEITAKFVVSGIDFFRTFNRLIGGGPALTQPLQPPSSSFFILYAASRVDLSRLRGSSSIGVFPSFDMESNFLQNASFKEGTTIGITIPTILDGSMAPEGVHSISAHEMVAHSDINWKKIKSRLTGTILTKVEKIIPGIKDSLIHLEAATPSTMAKYTGNTGGAAFGWEQTKDLRPCKTFIENLYLSGHWAGFGGGVVATAYSGTKTANEILKILDK